MSDVDQAAAAVRRAASTAADVNGNLEEAEYFSDTGQFAEAVQRLEWAKENVRMLPFRIDEALAAARKASDGAALIEELR